MRNFEAEIHKLSGEINTAIGQGRTDIVAQVKKDRDAKVDTLKRFKQAVNDQRLSQQARSNSQAQPQPLILSGVGNIQTPPSSQIPAVNPDSLDRGLQSRNSGSSLTSQETSGAHEIAGQTQGPMDSREVRPLQAVAFEPLQSTQRNPPPTISTSTPVQQQQPKSYWEGSLKWAGFDTSTRDRKELRVQVKVTCRDGNM